MNQPIPNLTPLPACKLILASDHAGFKLKTALQTWLSANPVIQLFDAGCHTVTRCDYPPIVAQAHQLYCQHQADFVILVCGSGIGMAMVANRYYDWRAYRFIENDWTGLQLARLHNHANVLTLGGRLVDNLAMIQQAIQVFLTTATSSAVRHHQRLAWFAKPTNLTPLDCQTKRTNTT